jgi:uncharacterized phage protein (TIGR01671 family)
VRDIRYRFWHKEFNKFVSPYGLGYQFQPENGQIYVEGCNITDRFIISQYTGLKDKNGKEIWESDIVKFIDLRYPEIGEEQGIVGFSDASFRIESEIVTHYRWIDYEVEVIGNVYDNPEIS